LKELVEQTVIEDGLFVHLFAADEFIFGKLRTLSRTGSRPR